MVSGADQSGSERTGDGVLADPQVVIYLTAGEVERFHEQIMLRAGQSTALLRDREPEMERIQTIPGVGRWTAEVLVAEIGTDLSRFPSASQLASWAGLCPGNDESAGKRRSGRTRKGSPWLRTTLVEAAQAAARTNCA